MVDVAQVFLWGRRVGAAAWNSDRDLSTFEYDPAFVQDGLPVSPITMPLRSGLFQFPELPRATYRGLPGLLADSLPDKYGSALIDEWLRMNNRTTFSPIEHLCYIGSRGMGALEFQPATHSSNPSAAVEVGQLAGLAAQVVSQRKEFSTELDHPGIQALFQVGTSAGGARAKALIIWNRQTNEVRTGQGGAPDGFEHWLLKFDGVGSGDKELTDPQGYGRIEYSYYLLAQAAGIEMMESALFDDAAGRSHFITKRFDRSHRGKRHVLTLSSLAHFDYNAAGAYSYEDAFAIARRLRLPASDLEQLYRRMVFNVIARNQDDHTKNISFAMNQQGMWQLTPAYDVTWAFNPSGAWTSRHQMTIAGKRDEFTLADLEPLARAQGIRNPQGIVRDITEAVGTWPELAEEAGVDARFQGTIAGSHRLSLA